MKKVIQCDLCNTWIDSKRFSGIVHLRCPKCGMRYQMDPASIKRHSMMPIAICLLALFISYRFIDGSQPLLKLIFVLCFSGGGTLLINRLFLKYDYYQYESGKGESYHEK